MKIEHIDINKLSVYQNNARTHSLKQIEEIKESFKFFQWTRPIIIDENYMILAGHGRYYAATDLGLKIVPCIIRTGLTQEQKVAYILADNSWGEIGGWDEDQLIAELTMLEEAKIDTKVTGFDFEIDLKEIEREERISSGNGVIEYEDDSEFDHICPECNFKF